MVEQERRRRGDNPLEDTELGVPAVAAVEEDGAAERASVAEAAAEIDKRLYQARLDHAHLLRSAQEKAHLLIDEAKEKADEERKFILDQANAKAARIEIRAQTEVARLQAATQVIMLLEGDAPAEVSMAAARYLKAAFERLA